MALLNHLDRTRQVLTHAQPRHDDWQPPPRKRADGDLVLDVTQLSAASTSGTQNAHIKQLLEQQVFLLPAERIGRV